MSLFDSWKKTVEEYLNEEQKETEVLSPVLPEPSHIDIKEPESPSKYGIEIFEPSELEEEKIIADRLKKGLAVVINYGFLDSVLARRMFHFMAGFVYASNAGCERMANDIFLYTPGGTSEVYRKTAKNISTLKMPWEK